MKDILFRYELNPTTWAYLSALLTIGIYFKFHRFWSVRNLDLVGLIALSPGLLSIFFGLKPNYLGLEQIGYVWLACVGAFFLVRLFVDPVMVRRPLLEPNLNTSGLTFTGIALLIFLVANLVANRPPDKWETMDRLEYALARQSREAIHNPGYASFYYVASFVNTSNDNLEKPPAAHPLWAYPPIGVQVAVARAVAIAALLALTLGMVVVGFRHFDNTHTGVAAASLFLLLPYIGQMTGRIDHLVPGAILVWAIAAYRRPVIAGMLMGLAGGLIFYPLFLLPLWCGFYWRRGLLRFLYGAGGALIVLVLFMVPMADDLHELAVQLKQMFGWTLFAQEGAAGLWQSYHPAYRVPPVTLFVVMAGSLGLWPAQKNLGTLLSCSATVMLGSQFIQAHQGGLYMAWYLPLLVLTVLRPNLEDRVALSAVIEGRTTWPAMLWARWQRRSGA